VRWWAWLIGAVLVVFAARWMVHFPWRETGRALARASVPILCLAAVVNLSSFLFKGTAWHLLLDPVAPNRWKTAMSATLIGAAVNNFGVSVTGEAARIGVMRQRDGVPLKAAVSSVVWSRATEGIGLALFIVLGTLAMPLPAWVRPVRIVMLVALLLLGMGAVGGGWNRLVGLLPGRVRAVLDDVTAIGACGQLTIPVLLGLGGWLAEWATYHLSMVAVCGPVPLAASFLALLAANIGGIPRLTPGNVGIMQAAFVVGLEPFGITAERAVAAGLASQAIQVLPVLLAGAVAMGLPGTAVPPPTYPAPACPSPASALHTRLSNPA
jgi:uncharacterized membrane protein YbhN (UPF0104 family)